jgi:hypothetical protein
VTEIIPSLIEKNTIYTMKYNGENLIKYKGKWGISTNNNRDIFFIDDIHTRKYDEYFDNLQKQMSRVVIFVEQSLFDEDDVVYRIMTGEEIYYDYWNFWYSKMLKKFGPSHELINLQNCIEDFITTYWAWDVTDILGNINSDG